MQQNGPETLRNVHEMKMTKKWNDAKRSENYLQINLILENYEKCQEMAQKSQETAKKQKLTVRKTMHNDMK